MIGLERDAAVQLVSRTTQLAGSRVVAAYLHGSLVSDDFVSGLSDLDVLVVVDQPVPEDAVGPLVDAAAAAGRAAGTDVDLRLVARDVVERADRNPILELGISVRRGRTPEAFVETRRGIELDLLIELSICRQKSEAIIGPDAAEVLFNVPPQWVTEVGVGCIEQWQERPFESKYSDLMVFTACRIWRFATDGVHVSKTAAALWAQQRRPDLEVLQVSLDRRGGVHRDPPVERVVRELLGVVLAEVTG